MAVRMSVSVINRKLIQNGEKIKIRVEPGKCGEYGIQIYNSKFYRRCIGQ